jgi:hypothetical protein
MITQFSKGFLGEPKKFAAFKAAVLEGDCNEIAIAASCSGGNRRFVDATVHASPNAIKGDSALYRIPLAANPAPDTPEFIEELQGVADMAKMRDEPLESLSSSLPRGYWEVSPILQEVVAQEKRPTYDAVDYMASKESWRNVQHGLVPLEELKTGSNMRSIKTLRDAAAYVHDDDPLAPFILLAKKILSEGFMVDAPDNMKDVSGFGRLGNFAVYGAPFVFGVLGEVLRVTGNISFYHKWTEWYPRPEEAAPFYDMGYLPMAYPEGSPMHPARNAMHSAAALALAYALIRLFQSSSDHALAYSGESIRDTALLLADNVGYFRIHGGVHYASDHTSFIPVAEAIAESVVGRLLRPR